MTTSPHVCCPGCLILSDEFDRSGPELGCQWEVSQGTWSITNNQLSESGNAGALVVTRREVSDASFYVLAGIRSVISGAVYRVIVNYKDSDNYHFVDVVYTSSNVTITLKRRLGGSEETLKTRTWIAEGNIGQALGLFTCLTDENWTACAGVVESALQHRCLGMLSPSLIADGRKAGLGNGSSAAIYYENFSFQETDRTNPHASCPSCRPSCCIPYWYVLCDTFDLQPPVNWELAVSTSSDCEVMDGLQGTLYPGDPHYESWEGIITVEDWGEIGLYLFCDSGEEEDDEQQQCRQYWLHAEYLGGADCDWYVFEGYPDTCTCDPLQLVFSSGAWHDGTDSECNEPCPNWEPITFTITCSGSFRSAEERSADLARWGKPDRKAKSSEGAAKERIALRFPPLRRQAWDLAKSLSAFVADGLRTVSPVEYQARLTLCDGCQERAGNRCRKCGCFVSLKARGRAFRCPLGKWPTVDASQGTNQGPLPQP